MDTNTISYYNWLCYNKPNKVISKRINIIMHKSDSFENLAVRSTLNNILVLPASLSHNIGFRYRPHIIIITKLFYGSIIVYTYNVVVLSTY